MPTIELDLRQETLRLAEPFRIATHVFETIPVIVAVLRDGAHRGRGEASGVFFLDEDADSMVAQIEDVRAQIEDGPSRYDLRSILPPGGARSAIDCAMWELEACKTGKSVYELAGIAEPRPLRTTFTLGADTPEKMASKAGAMAQAKSIKVKLTGDLELDIRRVREIRTARPDVWLGVDGNQGFVREQLDALADALEASNVSLLEQPLPRGCDHELENFSCPIPVAGDESILSLDDVAGAVGRFDVVNIKLDKCGGLTEGLMMAEEARRVGLGVMVGTMVGTSLATAPGHVLGQLCDLVDLDGPTFLARDRVPSVTYSNGDLIVGSDVWGPLAAD